jgi:hypothetical protein
MPERCTLDGFVITPIEPQGSRYAGTDHGRLFINEARTGVMAWWSMGRWTDGRPGGDHRPSHDHDARGLSPLVCPQRGLLPRRLTGRLCNGPEEGPRRHEHCLLSPIIICVA